MANGYRLGHCSVSSRRFTGGAVQTPARPHHLQGFREQSLTWQMWRELSVFLAGAELTATLLVQGPHFGESDDATGWAVSIVNVWKSHPQLG